MARPKSKQELISLSNNNFKKLKELVIHSSDTNKELVFPEGMMNRNVRDVLAHLHHWHLMMLEWYQVGMSGEQPSMPAKGYTWKTTPALNRQIWKDYQTVTLENIQQELNDSFENIQHIMHQHSDEELFEKKRYSWTGSTSLGSYLVSVSSSHYDWAFKLIKKAMKQSPK